MTEPDQTNPALADPSAVTVHEDGGPMPHIPGSELLRRGQAVGRYVVVEKLGAGSMGVVYRAYDPDLDRGIALKLVEIRARRGRRSGEIKARLLREAQAIARVQHPNVVQVFDVGGIDDGIFVAMEFVDGVTLKQWLRAKERGWRDVVSVFLHAGAGLAAAHRAEIIHRDFKPDNVMVGDGMQIRVLDFGLARAAGGFTSEAGARPDDPEPSLSDRVSSSGHVPIDQSLTRAGAVVGTPAYMSPEQHAGERVGPPSDQFSYCVALWEGLYGERPFSGETRVALASAMRAGRVNATPPGHGVPRWLHAAVVQGLAAKPRHRHASMDALLEAIDRDPAARWRRVGAASVGVIAVGGAIIGARFASGGDADPVCNGAPAKLAAVWSSQRRASIEAAFARSELPFATDSWEKARLVLDGFSQRWIEARTDACQATRVHAEQSEELMDLRMTCLDRALTQLDALLDVLTAGSREAVIGAVDAAFALDDLEACRDVSLVASSEPPGPQQRDEAAALQQALADVRALESTGAYVGLRAKLRELEPRVQALDYPPVTETFYVARAAAEQATGEPADARRSWEAAFREALVRGDARRAAYLASKLTFVVGHRIADTETGQFWADTAHALLRRAEDDSGETLASVWSAEASMAMTAGDYDHARTLDLKLYDYWQTHGPDDPDLANTLGNLAVVERERGELDAAVDYARESLALYKARYGSGHPEVGAASRRMAITLTYAGKHEEAKVMLDRALAIARAAYGDNGIEVALVLDGLGRALRRMDKLERSEALHREAYEIWVRQYGDAHPDVSVSLMNVGYTQLAAKKFEQAFDTFVRAGDGYAESLPEDHPSHLFVAAEQAQAKLGLERGADAIPVLERALALPAAATADPTLVAELQFLLAQALPAQSPRTRELATAALASYRRKAKHWGPQITEIETWLAQHDSAGPG